MPGCSGRLSLGAGVESQFRLLSRSIGAGPWSQPNSFYLVLRKPILGAIIELGRTRTLVGSHGLSMLQRSAIGKIRRDPGRAEAVVADRRHDAGCKCALADHAPGVALSHRLLAKRDPLMAATGPKQPALLVLADARNGDVGVQCFGERMVAGHDVLLATFLMQPDQPRRALGLQVLDLHRQRGTNAGEAVGEGGDQRAVPQIAHGSGRNAVE